MKPETYALFEEQRASWSVFKRLSFIHWWDREPNKGAGTMTDFLVWYAVWVLSERLQL